MSKYTTTRQRLLQAVEGDPSAKNNILSEQNGNRFHITFNRPARYNAFTPDMYQTFMSLVGYANQNADIKFIVVSGNGGNYSSGNDLANFSNERYSAIGTMEERSAASAEGLQQFCASIINSNKPIFALVEGKVIGFAFTQLALFDRVFAIQGAQFHAPLVQLAQGPEMCASYTFPKIFGNATGQDLIVKATKVDTSFLQKHGFLQKYKSKEEASKALSAHLEVLDNLQWLSYLSARKIFRDNERSVLLDVNHRECVNLVERWTHPNLIPHLAEYMQKIKSKSKL